MHRVRNWLAQFGKRPLSILLLSFIIVLILSLLLWTVFHISIKSRFTEKKDIVIQNFLETFQSYQSSLAAYGHLFSQLYGRGLVTSDSTFKTETLLANRREIRAICYFTIEQGQPAIRYLETFGTDNSEIDELLPQLDLLADARRTNGNQAIIKKINANYIIYMQPLKGPPDSPAEGYVYFLINQQDIFRMVSQWAPEHLEYRIYDVSEKPTPVYTHAMDEQLYFPFTAARITSDEILTNAGLPWLFRFYMYDSTYEILLFLLLLLITLLGIGMTVVLYTFSQRNYSAVRKAQHLESQKDEFVAIASHELKTPLTTIKALNQLLAQKMNVKQNSLYESFFRKMDTQIQRMENLINDLLDVSRIRSGKLTFKMSVFDLDEVVRSVSEDIDTLSRSHKVTVKGSLSQPVFGDKDRIAQVITNILINAAKYSPQANLIVITMTQTAAEATVSVTDYGIGISHENQKRIFDRFYRVTTEEHKYKGLGIGLFISSEIIRKHKGRIGVKSNPGKGSTFFFTLPLYNGAEK